MSDRPPSPGSNLCQSCGLCCDGSLFFNTPTGDVVEKGKESTDCHEEPTMPQPCMHHGSENGCGIYNTRPNVCRQFKCNLLKDLEQNKTSLSEALGVVVKLKTLREKLLTRVKTNQVNNEVQPLFKQLNEFHVLQRQGHSLHFFDHAEWFLDCIEFIQLVRKRLLPEFMKEENEDTETTSSS